MGRSGWVADSGDNRSGWDVPGGGLLDTTWSTLGRFGCVEQSCHAGLGCHGWDASVIPSVRSEWATAQLGRSGDTMACELACVLHAVAGLCDAMWWAWFGGIPDCVVVFWATVELMGPV